MMRPSYPRLTKRQLEKCVRLNEDINVAAETIGRWNNASTTPLIRILAQVQEFLCELYNRSEAAEERAKAFNQAETKKREVA